MSAIIASQIISMYGLYHVDTYVFLRWHVYVTYLIVTWVCCAIVLFANRALPAVNQLGLLFILASVFITIVICAAMPGTGGRPGHATTSFIWKDWVNSTGYSSDKFVFLMGMLNGAYAIGTPDCVSHLAEEIPNSRVNIPEVCPSLILSVPKSEGKNEADIAPYRPSQHK
jgi:choline transport protein